MIIPIRGEKIKDIFPNIKEEDIVDGDKWLDELTKELEATKNCDFMKFLRKFNEQHKEV